MGDMTITKESATIEAINQFGQVRRTMTIKPKEGWWQKQQRGKEETVAEIEVEVQNIATVGSVLNSNTIVQINVALARSSVLSQYGAEAVALYVDGFPAKDRSAEVRTSTQFGAFP